MGYYYFKAHLINLYIYSSLIDLYTSFPPIYYILSFLFVEKKFLQYILATLFPSINSYEDLPTSPPTQLHTLSSSPSLKSNKQKQMNEKEHTHNAHKTENKMHKQTKDQ